MDNIIKHLYLQTSRILQYCGSSGSLLILFAEILVFEVMTLAVRQKCLCDSSFVVSLSLFIFAPFCLQIYYNNPLQCYRTGTEWLQSCQVEEDVGMLAEHVPRWPRRPLSAIVCLEGPGQRFMAARVDETDDPFLLSSVLF